MDQRTKPAQPRGDPVIEAMERLIQLQLRVNYLEEKLGRLRRRERAVFRAFRRTRDADEALAILVDRHGRGTSDRMGEGTSGG